MKPEERSEKLLAETRVLEKLYALGMDGEAHDERAWLDADPLLLLAVGALGDAAAALNQKPPVAAEENDDGLAFAAAFFDSYLGARLGEELHVDISVLASCAYLIGRRPGSAHVIMRHVPNGAAGLPVINLLIWVLRGEWSVALQPGRISHEWLEGGLEEISSLVSNFFLLGEGGKELEVALDQLRDASYSNSDAYELLAVDLLCATIRVRVGSSTWRQLPVLAKSQGHLWNDYLRGASSPKELWPSQIKIGSAGLFAGKSGVVQMPTSAGKTKSIELIIRSSFIAKRAESVVVIAPFRALCREIAATFRDSFSDLDVAINEIPDTPQLDFISGLTIESAASYSIMVVTPEKYLYMLRNAPEIMPVAGLVIYDEGHQFDSGSRGVTYELLVTEIKALIPSHAQVVLVSAVVQNAERLAEWLIGPDAVVVDGSGIAPTNRTVAFATWLEDRGGLDFFDMSRSESEDFQVLGAIRSLPLENRRRERSARFFPSDKSASDIALYLSLRLAQSGAAAIFCGTKDSAEGLAERLVDIFERGVGLSAPRSLSDEREIDAIANLTSLHFGEASAESKVARLGMLLHHAGLPEGLRLACEYAMRRGKARLVVCTSTLAQGVNLPIRYLVVPSIRQGEAIMRTRDFQNLMGRAGRSGMHTEGTVIFTDVRDYDNRGDDSRKFERSLKLLDPGESEPLGSSLQTLVSQFQGGYSRVDVVSSEYFSSLLNKEAADPWMQRFVRTHRRAGIALDLFSAEISKRRDFLAALQSYLMANSFDGPAEVKEEQLTGLAKRTLAYFLASEVEKEAIVDLFAAVARDNEEKIGPPDRQIRASRTMLGTASTLAISSWVGENFERLAACESSDQLLEIVWPLFSRVSGSKLVSIASPKDTLKNVALGWMNGVTYGVLIELGRNATRPWGDKRRAITKSSIMSFIDGAISYELVLVIGAIRIFSASTAADSKLNGALELLQKRLKYGLPDSLSISIYESGYADRAIALTMAEFLKSKGYPFEYFSRGVVNGANVREVLESFPSYFRSLELRRK